LWVLLAGRRLWEGCNEATVARRLFEHDLPELALPDTPARLLSICRRALAPAVEQRYPSAEAFRQELERFMQDEGLDASVRAIGKRVAAGFASERADTRTRIDQELRTLTAGSTVAPIGLWRDAYRGEQADRTLGSGDSEPRVADPDEVTTDYGPRLDVGAPRPEPAVTTLPGRPARVRTRWAIAGIVSVAALALAPLLWSEQRDDEALIELEPSSVPPTTAAVATDCSAPNKPKVRLSGEIDEDATLSCARDYLLVFNTRVAPGVTLTIEPGTTIYGDRETKGTLVIQPGARLLAEGTATHPIVFTSELPEPERRPGDWGGLIMLGQAPINLRNAQGQPMLGQVEGLTDVGRYGGDDPDDDSGVLRYVRIEYPGSELAPGNEINGLTLAGVGRKTVIDHVQVRSSSDDCFEFFGGTIDAKHLVCDTPGDDALDFDHGYQGRLQFVVVRDQTGERIGYGPDDTPGHGLEIDNDPNGTTAAPRTSPKIWNATLCGTAGEPSLSFAILARRASQAELRGVVMGGFDFALDRRDAETRFALEGVAWLDQPLAEVDERDDDGDFDELAWLAEPARASLADIDGLPSCRGPMPASLLPGTPLVPAGAFAGPPDDGFFDPDARYLGAFAGPDDDWTAGWVRWSE
ncbi:MAG TPA: hypothetical protein VM869_18655, partial [Enhygromyxa sp.]|nr:hypothetical protein [Enhygromyxa sp.]